METQVITTIILGITGILITLYHHWHLRRLNRDKMNKELFTEFNDRYNDLNDSLLDMVDKKLTLEALEKHPDFKKDLIDYFNLCAEEYYWFRKKRIDKKVWFSWYAGMNYWYSESEVIKEMWRREIQGEGYQSYYLNRGDNLFKTI
jgi:hypothetical protein